MELYFAMRYPAQYGVENFRKNLEEKLRRICNLYEFTAFRTAISRGGEVRDRRLPSRNRIVINQWFEQQNLQNERAGDGIAVQRLIVIAEYSGALPDSDLETLTLRMERAQMLYLGAANKTRETNFYIET